MKLEQAMLEQFSSHMGSSMIKLTCNIDEIQQTNSSIKLKKYHLKSSFRNYFYDSTAKY